MLLAIALWIALRKKRSREVSWTIKKDIKTIETEEDLLEHLGSRLLFASLGALLLLGGYVQFGEVGRSLEDKDCADFTTWQEVQQFYESERSWFYPDPHHLDLDRDGIACEALRR